MASGIQSSPTKSRSVLSRTLVLVLNPLSDASSTPQHRLTCRKIEKVFEDFKQCNKHGISVPLRDAIDDIDLVGWLSPFTLLIRGSSEDMDTIEQAWVGRMLKPPGDFVIKDFGEIAALNIKEIPQSQFISICETLLQIITSLNENQIRATLECIMSRLCSSFDSIVIPPLSAVRRSLNLLVKEMKLEVIEDSYYVRITPNFDGQSLQTFPVDDSGLCGRRWMQSIQPDVNGSNNQPFKKKRQVKNPYLKDDNENSNLKKCRERKEKNTGSVVPGDHRNPRALAGKKGFKTTRIKNKMERRDMQQGKLSTKGAGINIRILQGNHVYDKLTNQDTCENLEIEDSTAKKKKSLERRFSVLGKLSRLFKRAYEEELTNGRYLSGSEDQFNDIEEPLTNDEHTILVSNSCKRSKSGKNWRKKQMKSLEKKTNPENEKNKKSFKDDHYDVREQFEAKQVDSKIRYKIPHKRDSFTSANFKSKRSSRTSNSVNSCSSNECRKGDVHVGSVRRSINVESRKHIRSKLREKRDPSPDFDFHSSISESSCSADRFNSESDSNTSDSCVESSTRKTSHHTAEVIHTDRLKHRSGEDRNYLNSCSTQAICGDLEVSAASLTFGEDANVKEHDKEPSHCEQKCEEERNNDIQSRNLLQLIGVL